MTKGLKQAAKIIATFKYVISQGIHFFNITCIEFVRLFNVLCCSFVVFFKI